MSKLPSFASCVIAISVGLVLGQCLLFWNFIADDAYILMRYAMNLTRHGQWVFNINDYITAMTSPLHGIIESILYFITRELPYTNKIVSLLAMLIVSVLGYNHFKAQRLSQLLFIVLFAGSPFVMVWTMGGLETPYLSLILFLMVRLTSKLIHQYTFRRLLYLSILSGLCFICRFDAILFIAFLFPFLFFKLGWKSAFKWGVMAAIIPLLWLLFSNYYYGDIFPTSFYEKHPRFSDRAFLLQNLNYIIDFLVSSGIIVVLLIIIVWGIANRSLRLSLSLHFRNSWYAYFGLYAIFLYGMGSATVHMMFSYRMFVPYMSVMAFLFADMVKQQELTNISRYFAFSIKAISLIIVVFNVWLTHYIMYTAINPSRNPWDYPRTSLNDYIVSQDILAESGKRISEHWKTQPQSATRGPRILSPAEGVVTYDNPDAYVMGYLVSLRKNYNFFEALPVADYFGNASVIPNPMIVNPEAQMKKIYDKSSPVYGVDCHWYIYFREGVTAANPIPNTINGITRTTE